MVAQTQKEIKMNYLKFYSSTGEVCEKEDILITCVVRNGHIVSIEGEKQGYCLDQQEIYPLLQPGDMVEENYCHGWYTVVFE